MSPETVPVVKKPFQVIDVSQNHPLWPLLGLQPPNPSPLMPNVFPASRPYSADRDKSTASSLRLLLCDAQSTLEAFSSDLGSFAEDIKGATRSLDETAKVVEDGQIKAVEDMKSHCTKSLTSSVPR